MSVQLQSRPTNHSSAATPAMPRLDFDLDAVDHAIDHGDLDSVRSLLGLTETAWRLVLAKL